MSSPKVLFVTCHLPFPPVSGGRLREYELLKRLSGDFEMHLGVVSKTYDEDAANAPILQHHCATVAVFPADPPPAVGTSELPFQLARHRSRGLTTWVRRQLLSDPPDVLHLEGFYVMQHVPDECTVPIFLVEQNVEYVLWRQRTEAAATNEERDRNLREYLKTLDAEINAWRRSDLCGAVTDDDRQLILAAAGELDVRVVGDGADHLTSVALPSPNGHRVANASPTVTYIANFGYQPNVDAAVYLYRDIWPRIKARVAGVRLVLVGNAPPAEVQAMSVDRQITVTGRVSDVQPYLDAADVIVCPLRIGGGVKVKVLEALMRGKALVTTTVGVQGLGPAAAAACLVEDEPWRFAQAVVRLLRRPPLRADLEQRATRFAARLPRWDDAARAVADCYRELIDRRRRLASGNAEAISLPST